MAIVPGTGKIGAGRYEGRTKWALATVIDGAAEIGEVPSVGESVPAGAVIVGGFLIVEDELTSDDDATVAIGLDSTNDVLASASLAEGLTDLPLLKKTDGGRVTATVAEAALTGGRARVAIAYVEMT